MAWNHPAIDRATDVVAIGGITSSFWTSYMPWLNETFLVPVASILGIIWLLIKIVLLLKGQKDNE